jgi:hypothetical protein
MHYIAGTYFTVAPQRAPITSSNRFGNLLPHGQTYQLFNIKKHDEGIEYCFVDANRKVYKAVFKSTRDADSFISFHRKEKLPDYNALKVDEYEQVDQ